MSNPFRPRVTAVEIEGNQALVSLHIIVEMQGREAPALPLPPGFRAAVQEYLDQYVTERGAS